MSENSLALAGQSRRFNTAAIGHSFRPVPSSPMVLQMLVHTLARLNQKVDDLAARPPQVIEVRPVAPQVVESKPPVKAPEKKVDRSKLRRMFD